MVKIQNISYFINTIKCAFIHIISNSVKFSGRKFSYIFRINRANINIPQKIEEN